MIATTHDEFVSEIIDADDRCNADERDERQEQLEAYQSRQLNAQVLVARQLLAYLQRNSRLQAKLSYRRDSARRRLLRRSGSFEVTDFGTTRKAVYFLLVNSTLLTSNFSPFPSYCKLLVKFALSRGCVSL